MSHLKIFFVSISFLSSVPSTSHHTIFCFVHRYPIIHCSYMHLFHFVAAFFLPLL